jgi:hypothetical protein
LAVISPKQINESGVVISFTAATSGGDSIINSDGKSIILVKNGGASSITVSATAITPCPAGALHNLLRAVDAGETVGIKLSTLLNGLDDGQVDISYTSATSVEIAAVKF